MGVFKKLNIFKKSSSSVKPFHVEQEECDEQEQEAPPVPQVGPPQAQEEAEQPATQEDCAPAEASSHRGSPSSGSNALGREAEVAAVAKPEDKTDNGLASAFPARCPTAPRPKTSSVPAPPPPEWAAKLDAVALKMACKERGLPRQGTRKQLLDRIARCEAQKAAEDTETDLGVDNDAPRAPEILDLCEDSAPPAAAGQGQHHLGAAAELELEPSSPRASPSISRTSTSSGKTLEARCQSPEQVRRRKNFEDSGPLPKAMLRSRRKDAGFGGLVIRGRNFKEQVSLPGTMIEEDPDEFLMDNILEETGAAFGGTALVQNQGQPMASSTGSRGFPGDDAPAQPLAASLGASGASGVGLSGTSQYIAQFAAMEDKHWRIEEELMNMGLDELENLGEQQALLSSLRDSSAGIDPDEEVAVLLQSLQQGHGLEEMGENLCPENDGELDLSLCSLQCVEVC